MFAKDFLQVTLPAEGIFVLGVLPLPTETNPRPKLFNKFHTTIDSLLEDAKAEQSKNRDVYVTPATFHTSGDRKASNAKLIKSFFLDLDVGEGPLKHPSKRDAVLALAKFIADTNLPTPTLIDSGGGVHVYWVLDEALSVYDWFPLASRLKKLCKQKGLVIDPTVTSDAARVMRLVGFENLKRGKPTTVRSWKGETSLEKFKQALDANIEAPSWLDSAKKDWMKSSPMATAVAVHPDRVSVFKGIAVKSVKGVGCHQLAKCITDQANIPEPLWRAALSVAWACEDGSETIHKLSSKHPDYDYDATIAKAMATKGPYRCETFDDTLPGICPNCEYWGKITSPIQLGSTLRGTPTKSDGTYEVEEPSTDLMAPPQFHIPQYPAPYFRPASGGVALRVEPGDGEPPLTLPITDVDFWVERLIRDAYTGDLSVWIRSWHPKQGLIDFSIPNCVSQGADLMKKLEQKGLIFSARSTKHVQDYVYRAIKAKNNEEQALPMSARFGWDDSRTSFTWGSTRFTPGSFQYAPPSPQTSGLVPLYSTKGDLELWKRALANYCVPSEEYYPMLTAILTAPASLLMPFTGKNGIAISFVGESGTGKTTAQMVGLSFFGHPAALLSNDKDSAKSMIERLASNGNMPFAYEEATLMSTETLRKILYDLTEGRSGNQANQYGGGEKISGRMWQLTGSFSTNESLRVKLSQEKGATQEALLARLIELPMPPSPIGPKIGNQIELTIKENYGLAAEVYIPYLVANTTNVAKRVVENITTLPSDLYGAKERFQAAAFGALITAAEVVNQCGLMHIDLERYRHWLFVALRQALVEQAALIKDILDPMQDFIAQHSQQCVNVDINMQEKPYVVDPDRIRHPIVMRYEKDSNNLYVASAAYKTFCLKNGHNYEKSIANLKANNVIKNASKVVRLAAGVTGPSSRLGVRCIHLQYDGEA